MEVKFPQWFKIKNGIFCKYYKMVVVLEIHHEVFMIYSTYFWITICVKISPSIAFCWVEWKDFSQYAAFKQVRESQNWNFFNVNSQCRPDW